jgi:hypothetical protein
MTLDTSKFRLITSFITNSVEMRMVSLLSFFMAGQALD